jgi:hypothetical protein
MKKSELKALIREVVEEMNNPRSDFVNQVKNKPFVVVVTDSDTGKKREVGFDDHDAAMDFKLAAEEDGTYWGFHQNKL